MKERFPDQVFNRAKKVRILILDVDGVLTDGKIIMDYQGRELKAYDVRDGHGIKLLLRAGIEVAMVTGRKSSVVEKRAEDLGVKRVRQGVYNKIEAYMEIAQEVGIKDEEVCFVGDDLIDIPLLKRVGLPIVVADGLDEAKEFALYITRSSGGRGAVREVCELLLQAHGKWEEILRRYS